MGYSVIVSDDGGKSFSNSGGGSHADWHDVWINPTNTKHLIGADDGGVWYSYDGGTRWWKAANLPISQFYHASADDKDPYQVYGGLQDNSSWVGDQEYPGGITNSRWENLYGGDGFWVFADPSDNNYTYVEYQGGHIARVNRKTLEARNIQPMGGYKEKLRWNWNSPIALSPNEKGTLYIGSQFLFRTRDHGVTWDRISPDLTTNDPLRQRQEQSGGITVDNSSAEMNTTIYSISESPVAGGTIWVGTDDGNVQVTRNGGAAWTNATPAMGLPQGNWISWVEASRFNAGTAYATNDRHMFGDMQPYLYRTTDYGRTWQRLVGPGTPGVRGYAHVIKEDRLNPNILYLGTEHGMFVSLNGGASWAQFKPTAFPDGVSVRDIAVQPQSDDLVLATHGRGIWIVDDVSPLRSLGAETLSSAVALLPVRPVEQRIQGNGGWAEGDASYAGDNPPGGAIISYLSKGAPRRRPDEARDPRCAGQCRRRASGLQAARAQPRGLVDADQAAAGAAGGDLRLQLGLRPARHARPIYRPADQERRGRLDPGDGHARSARDLQHRRPPGPICRGRAGQDHVHPDEYLVAQLNGARGQIGALAASETRTGGGQGGGGATVGQGRCAAQADRRHHRGRRDHRRGAPCASRPTKSSARSTRSRTARRRTRWRGSMRSIANLKDVEAQWAAMQANDLNAFNAQLQAAGLKPVAIAAIALRPRCAAAGRVRAGVGQRSRRHAFLRQCRGADRARRQGLEESAGAGHPKVASRPCTLRWLSTVWSGRRDSNPRPQPWQGCALPLSYARSELSREDAHRSAQRLGVAARLAGRFAHCKTWFGPACRALPYPPIWRPWRPWV